MRCGLLGKTLGHSYSPALHAMLGDYSYALFEKTEAELPDFLRGGGWDGLNVTIPYKKAVVPYCAALSPAAERLQSVNTLVRRPDGTIYGDNTDLAGFLFLFDGSGLDVRGKKALVLGSGGASVTVCEALRQRGAGQVVVISRFGPDNYDNLDRHADAALIVNATPVGMYPRCGEAPLSLAPFPNLEGVLDLIYNPARTALCLEAERRDLVARGGLAMLAAQARASAEQFLGREIPADRVGALTEALRKKTENLILVGMPGCGKTTVGRALAAKLGRPFLDADEELVRTAGRSIPEIFAQEGEAGFRARETEVLRRLGGGSGAVVATGGGAVLREENYDALHQNGHIVWLRRDLGLLPREGRPLSKNADLAAMYEARAPRYARFADAAVENDGTPEDAAEAIISNW